jgi:hypothetical protein
MVLPQPFDFESPNKDYGMYLGMVESRDDPRKQGRVRVTIPGMIEPGKWAHTVMPGSPFNTGLFAVPAVGGQVLVGFLGGDSNQPVVLGGIAPPDTSVEDLPKCVFLENEDLVVALGKSETNIPYFSIYTREAEPLASITIDIDRKLIEVKGPSAVEVKSDGLVKTTSPLMQLGDRIVQPNKKVI